MTDRSAQERLVADRFAAQFGVAPAYTVFAPGRVNLLGEHTDYNGGYVLPMALRDLGVAIAIAPGDAPGQIDLHSITLDDTRSVRLENPASGHWSDYVIGCVKAVAVEQVASTGVRMSLSTSLALGAGLSSSAALEVASLRALSQQFDLELAPEDIARIAQRVENDYVGLPCGIMDQFASSVGTPGTALFLNTRTLVHEIAPKLPGHVFLVVDSGVSHQLTDSGYATRVAECQEACAALGVDTLSDLGAEDLPRVNTLPEPLNRRAEHVMTDNRLAQEGLVALRDGDAATFGQLMTDSHATARDNYEITVRETNALVATALDVGALGARQTGGGWGGAVIVLVSETDQEQIAQELTRRCPGSKLLAVT